MSCTLIVPPETADRLTRYAADLRTGQAQPGRYLAGALREIAATAPSAEQVLAALLDTKRPCIFAESAVSGDSTDWTLRELGLLGDLSVATDVMVYDDGRHTAPAVHDIPFPATLVFTPGALLRNDRGRIPADWREVTDQAGQLDRAGYAGLYRRRLRPVFEWIQDQASRLGVRAFVTVPGLGCGQFAGPFRGRLGSELEAVLEQLLAEHAPTWPDIRAVYYDPYQECASRRVRHHTTEFFVRPLAREPGGGHPQLCTPTTYSELPGDDFTACRLYSLVAWDHVSWPGNDFNGGSRATDDGVKSAATSALYALTGIEGHYDPAVHAYTPPQPHKTWSEILSARGFPPMRRFPALN